MYLQRNIFNRILIIIDNMLILNVLKKYKDQITLTILWFLIILIVNPQGDFPLNDDWCYGKSVKTLTDYGYFKLYNWGEMTLVAHVYFGYFFTNFFGFSFTVLRWSTLLMAGVSIIGVYELCKQIKTSRWIGITCALLCMVNPIFMGLSFSFMTDVPFYSVSIWAFYFFIRAMHTDRWTFLIIAILLCCWAFLIRQIALVFPLAWLITMVYTKKRDLNIFIKALLPTIVLALLYFSYTEIMTSQGLLQGRYNDRLYLLFNEIKQFDIHKIKNVIGYLLVTLSYLGFLLVPVHIFYIIKNGIKPFKWLIVLYTFLVTGLLIYTGKVIPNLHNVWIDFGIGPTTLYDYYGNFTETPLPRAPKLLWWLVTIVGVFSSVSFFLRLKQVFQLLITRKDISQPVVFSLVYFVIYIVPFLIVGVYDRYLLPLLPATIILLFNRNSKSPSRLFKYNSLVFVFLIGLFSVCATHDYLSWNRVRWEVITKLKESGVRPDHIQGGAEYTTWYYFSEEEDSWWEKIIPVYTLVFNPATNDTIVETYSYERWLPGEGNISLIYNSELDKYSSTE